MHDLLEQQARRHEAAQATCTSAAIWIRKHFERDTIDKADTETVRQLAKLAMSALREVSESVEAETMLLDYLSRANETTIKLAHTITQLSAKLEALTLIVAKPRGPMQ